MKSIVMLCVLILLTVNYSAAFPSKAGNCPMASSVKTCTPKCTSDYQCFGNKRCCPNVCGWSSCAEPSAVPHDDKHDTEKVVYCENVKCQPKQICKLDPRTKRSKCAYP
ncbi:hypothetical protein WDU94_005168 [Cyamophila willieti]